LLNGFCPQSAGLAFCAFFDAAANRLNVLANAGESVAAAQGDAGGECENGNKLTNHDFLSQCFQRPTIA